MDALGYSKSPTSATLKISWNGTELPNNTQNFFKSGLPLAMTLTVNVTVKRKTPTSVVLPTRLNCVLLELTFDFAGARSELGAPSCAGPDWRLPLCVFAASLRVFHPSLLQTC